MQHYFKNDILEARKNFGIRVDIYEYETFHTRLSDMSNGIFLRHFPDIDKQISIITQQRLLLAQPASTAHEIAMLRVSCALSFHDLSNQARRNVFDNLTLTILGIHQPLPVKVDVLIKDYACCVPGLITQADQVRASLERLHARGLVYRSTDGYAPNEKTKIESEAAIIALNRGTESLLLDVVDSVEMLAGDRLSDDDKRQVYQNTRAALSELFRISGLDLANQIGESNTFVVIDAHSRQAIVGLAKVKLSNRLGENLVAAIGDLLAHPEPDQAEVLATWCRTFVGAQLMHLDPTLNEFQATKFARKTFVLDTDTVLDAVVTDAPNSKCVLSLTQKLLSLGCQVVIPLTVVQECIEHAQHSQNTFNYFGSTGASFPPEYIEERVNNVFVKGYFYAIQNHTIPLTISYKQYLSNYYEPSNAEEFFSDVLSTIFPEGVTIAASSELLAKPIDEGLLKRVEDQLFKEMKHSRKADYRTDEQTKALAHTDAEIYVLVQQMNRERGPLDKKLMGGNVYLVTSSRRYIRAAKVLGIADRETVLPKTLIIILERIAGPVLSASEVLHLFENPFIAHAVTATWNDVKTLVQAGVNTAGTRVTRLRWDLDQSFHELLTNDENGEAASTKDTNEVKSFEELVITAKRRGYTLVPEVEAFVSRYEHLKESTFTSQSELSELFANTKKLAEKIEEFGKRKQKYLRRMVGQ